MNVKEKNNDIVIEESNYFQGELQLNNGNIVTKKEDKMDHGFGIKSIRLIVKENHGMTNITINEDQMFFITIHLPLQPGSKLSSEA